MLSTYRYDIYIQLCIIGDRALLDHRENDCVSNGNI